jgi:hypothetical protein
MKEALREAGVPTAASTAADSAARSALRREVGFPLILKPRAGAGAQGTVGRRRRGELERRSGLRRRPRARSPSRSSSRATRASTTPSPSTGGSPTTSSPLLPERPRGDADRWISPQFIATNRIDAADYAEVRELGRASSPRCSASGPPPRTWSGSSAPRACASPRSAAGHRASAAWDLYSAANDLDLYREWAHAIVPRHGSSGQPALLGRHRRVPPGPRRHITGYSGIDEVQRATASGSSTRTCPPPAPRPSRSRPGYMANAYVRMRHPTTTPARHARRRRPDRPRPRRLIATAT